MESGLDKAQKKARDKPHDKSRDQPHDKSQLRSALLQARKAMSDDDRSAFNTAIGDQVIAWATSLVAHHPEIVIGVYWPIRNEPDLRPTYAALIAQGVQLALPVVVDKDVPLRFVRWTPGDAMLKDSFGVAIPANQTIVNPQALLIPCVGFNRERLRLGYGGGFYDRTLAIAPRPTTVGIGYANGLAEFEGAAHDIALDLILTETGHL
ncbi:5-formyltetrahydrofolate cyclo-ligase [Glaciimonas sp. PCH181]|uniref:5-formyltetrahydrofolate cyclo-ligase n=1 Tax=Glaciimonas sp. PCH181 TaxID=2133943 RepID=UPI001CEC3B18|nr:5-formyltetrahydrofolate cyclo-ligase [Glaciimonas sp. PCH181]